MKVNKHRMQNVHKWLTKEESEQKRKEEEIAMIVAKEEKRKEREKYSSKKFQWRSLGIFLITFLIAFVFSAVTLIMEWNRESRYYSYSILFWILVWTFSLFRIRSDIEDSWEEIYKLKPEKQRKEFCYDKEYIYTDSQRTLTVYIICKTLLRIVSLAIVIIWWYLLLEWLGNKIKDMDLKSIVIVWMIIIMPILWGIYQNTKNKE